MNGPNSERPGKPGDNMNKLPPNKNQSKNIALLLIVVLIVFFIGYLMMQNNTSTVTNIPYSEFLSKIENGEITSVRISEDSIQGKLNDGNLPFETYIPYADIHLLDRLMENKVKVLGVPKKSMNPLTQSVVQILFWVLILGLFWFFMFRQVQGSGNRAMSFGRSRARLHDQSKKKVTFQDVAGEDEAKQELEEVIDFLKEPKKFQKIGARIPKGVLLIGPPGTGKTLLARAVAGEANVPFFSISGSDFVEMFVGVGASRVRDLFVQGKKNAPCILFIDEIDAVGRHRGAGLGGGHDEREQTLNQLLVEMDGFEANEGVILISATNRPDVLDPALLRPGRFDRQVMVVLPDIKGREGILKVHSNKVKLDKSVDLAVLARGTPGFTGADLENLVNEAALLAARRNHHIVTMAECEEAKDKVLMGPERKSMIFKEEEKKTTAYHESGHTLLGLLLSHSDPIHKVTIIPRGSALGLTQHLPESDVHTRSKSYWLDQIVILLGGMAAEEIVFNEMTTGAQNDIKRATDIARRMITEWGMSTKLGPVYYGENEKEIFLGREITEHKKYGEETAKRIDEEVKNLIHDAYTKTKKLLKDQAKKLEALAKRLIEKESLGRDEVIAVTGIKKAPKDKYPLIL